MRLDHIAYRTASRIETSRFFVEAFGYRIQQEFEIPFKDSKSLCIVLEPGNKQHIQAPWTTITQIPTGEKQEYHLEPEIFISDGDGPGNVVWEWVQRRSGIGGIHHMAYQVPSVEAKMKEWQDKGWAEFSTPQPIKCDEDEMIQVFSKPHKLTGVIFEFIERGEFGFCKANVRALMESTIQFNN